MFKGLRGLPTLFCVKPGLHEKATVMKNMRTPISGLLAILMMAYLSMGLSQKASAQCAAGETPVDIITESAIGFFGSDQFSWALRDAATNALIDTFVCGQFWFGDDVRSVCLDNAGTYVFNAWDRGGDGWAPGGGGYRIENVATGCQIGAGVPDNGLFPGLNPFDCADNELEEVFMFDLADIVGCTEPTALNYDPCATINGGCIFPLSNDECVDAIPLTVNTDGSCDISYLGTTIGATENPIDDPVASSLCGDGDPYPADVWFTVDIPATGTVNLYWLQTPGSSMNVDIYTGTCGSLVNSTMTACTNYFPFDSVIINEAPGSTVYVRVWDFGSDLFGTIEICATDPLGSVSCSSDNPPINLSTSSSATSIDLSWDAIPNSIGCEVRGREVGTSAFASTIIIGTEPDSYSIPLTALNGGLDYEWHVRCACSVSPVDATLYSALDTFTAPTPRVGDFASSSLLAMSSFPIPANNTLTIEMESLIEKESVLQIYNTLGQLVFSEEVFVGVGTNQNTVDVSNLQEGAYFIQVPGFDSRLQFVVAR